VRLRTPGRKIIHSAEPQHNDRGIILVVREDMRPTVLTETPPFTRGGFVAFEARFTSGHGEPLGGGKGAGAKDGAMNLPTGVAMAMFEAVDFTLDFIPDRTIMTTSCEHYVSPLIVTPASLPETPSCAGSPARAGQSAPSAPPWAPGAM